MSGETFALSKTRPLLFIGKPAHGTTHNRIRTHAFMKGSGTIGEFAYIVLLFWQKRVFSIPAVKSPQNE
jgi:hypothetical protein